MLMLHQEIKKGVSYLSSKFADSIVEDSLLDEIEIDAVTDQNDVTGKFSLHSQYLLIFLQIIQ